MKKKLLLELARHLEDGKLGHKRFDFNDYNNISKPRCGTAGCAIGELPILYPEKWKFDEEGIPVLIRKTQGWNVWDAHADAEKFFGLSYEEVDHLFYPNNQNTDEFGGFELGNNATKNQVASNIRDFIEIKESK